MRIFDYIKILAKKYLDKYGGFDNKCDVIENANNSDKELCAKTNSNIDIDIENECVICINKLGIILLCEKCKLKYCNDCAIKVNGKCCICFRQNTNKNRINLYYDDNINDFDDYEMNTSDILRVFVRFVLYIVVIFVGSGGFFCVMYYIFIQMLKLAFFLLKN